MDLELTSGAFRSGGSIPARYTCDGRNVSPPLAWRYLPSGLAGLALIVDDPGARRGVFSHWVVYNIPPGTDHLDEGLPRASRLEGGATQGRNDAGNTGYDGPCPPRGEEHTYYFRLYALDEDLALPAGLTRAQVLARIRDHTVASTEMQATYRRS